MPGSMATGIRTALVMHGEPDTGPHRLTPARTGRHRAITTTLTTVATSGEAATAIAIGMRTGMTMGITSTVMATDTATITNLQSARGLIYCPQRLDLTPCAGFADAPLSGLRLMVSLFPQWEDG